jgi:hypothetical protein
MATTENMQARNLTLALHTDLQNLDNYAADPALIAGLLRTAEEKLSIVAQYLANVRRKAGIAGAATIIEGAAHV